MEGKVQAPYYQMITDFVFREDKPEKADVIFVPGNNIPDLAIHAAGLYHAGYSKLILPSGRFAKQKGVFPGEQESEWAFLRGVLLENGVPDEAILKEDQATFTWENAILSRKVLKEKEIGIGSAILCCQAYHAARAYMYYKQQFPEVRILVCPVPTEGVARDNWYLTEHGTELVLGELKRIGEQFHCMLPVTASEEQLAKKREIIAAGAGKK